MQFKRTRAPSVGQHARQTMASCPEIDQYKPRKGSRSQRSTRVSPDRLIQATHLGTVDAVSPAPAEVKAGKPTCLDRCRNALSARAAVLAEPASVDSAATVLETSVGGSGSLRLHLASASTAARPAEVLGLVSSPLPHRGWPTPPVWLGRVGEVGFVLTALPSGGRP